MAFDALDRPNHLDQVGGTLLLRYDFSTDGGAVGTQTSTLTLPAGAIIRINSHLDVLTAPTSGGSATIALGVNTTTDLLAATAIASVTGVMALPSAAVKLTADRTIKMTIAVAALTAGKFNLWLDYRMPR